MSIQCIVSKEKFVLKGIDGYPADVVLEPAHPGWSARPSAESGLGSRDSALTRTRAVERLLRQVLVDERQLARVMDAVDSALAEYPD